MNYKFVPNIISLFNLFIGCIVVLILIENNIEVKYVFLLTSICLLLDFFDGFIARKFNIESKLGIQLDSLADIISFGLVPGILMYNMFKEANSSSFGSILSSFIPFLGFVITVFSAYRLARFNISKSNSNYFLGLPTPANTILIYSISIIFQDQSYFSEQLNNYYFLILITLLSAFLLSANIKLLNLKFNHNKARFLLIFISITSLILLGIYALPILILVYILISLLIFRKSK